MYDKIKSETLDLFQRLYPYGTLEDITGEVVRYLAYNLKEDITLRQVVSILDEINMKLSEIALEEMRREADEE